MHCRIGHRSLFVLIVMVRSKLIALPTEMQEEIVRRVGRSSLKDLFNLKVTCKTVKDVSESFVVYASIDLFSFTVNQSMTASRFIVRCYESGNLDAIYIKGTHDYFFHNRRDDGLLRIKRAADGGCEIALYTYGMLRAALHDDGASLSQLTKEFVRRISSTLLDHRTGRVRLLRDLAAKREEFVESMLPLIYGCGCTPYRTWYFWFDNGVENHRLCDSCFWSSHLGIFYYFFTVVTFPDTKHW